MSRDPVSARGGRSQESFDPGAPRAGADTIAFYLDSANLDDVSPLLSAGLASGVTSNPEILVRDGHRGSDRARLYSQFEAAGAGEIMMQACGPTLDALQRDALSLAELGERIVVKVPASPAGFEVGADLVAREVPILVTAVYTVAQAAIAVSIGATYVTPYAGRLTDAGLDAIELIERMQRTVDGGRSRLLVASVRSVAVAESLVERGVDRLTVGVPLFHRLMSDARSEAAVEAFERAASDNA